MKVFNAFLISLFCVFLTSCEAGKAPPGAPSPVGTPPPGEGKPSLRPTTLVTPLRTQGFACEMTRNEFTENNLNTFSDVNPTTREHQPKSNGTGYGYLFSFYSNYPQIGVDYGGVRPIPRFTRYHPQQQDVYYLLQEIKQYSAQSPMGTWPKGALNGLYFLKIMVEDGDGPVHLVKNREFELTLYLCEEGEQGDHTFFSFAWAINNVVLQKGVLGLNKARRDLNGVLIIGDVFQQVTFKTLYSKDNRLKGLRFMGRLANGKPGSAVYDLVQSESEGQQAPRPQQTVRP